MTIDCHGHYTTAPSALQRFCDEQVAGLKANIDVPSSANARISDDEIRDSLENTQLKLQLARHGLDDILAARVGHGSPHRQPIH